MSDFIDMIADFLTFFPFTDNGGQKSSKPVKDPRKIATLQYRPVCNIMKTENAKEAKEAKEAKDKINC